MITKMMTQFKQTKHDVEGKIAVPILLWLMGVPGIIVFLLWLFFFRG